MKTLAFNNGMKSDSYSSPIDEIRSSVRASSKKLAFLIGDRFWGDENELEYFEAVIEVVEPTVNKNDFPKFHDVFYPKETYINSVLDLKCKNNISEEPYKEILNCVFDNTLRVIDKLPTEVFAKNFLDIYLTNKGTVFVGISKSFGFLNIEIGKDYATFFAKINDEVFLSDNLDFSKTNYSEDFLEALNKINAI